MTSDARKTGHDRTALRLMRGVDYIERRIAEPISLSDVAAQAALSDHHFHRLFRSRYGIPVMDYVRRRRLAQAAERLVRSGDPILVIALDAGFESQAAFTRAFRRVFHATPAVFRARGRDVPWLSASALSEETLSTLPELRDGAPRRVAVEAFKVAGLSATFTGDARAEIPALWGRLAGLLGPDAFLRGARFGISLAPFAAIRGSFEYIAAVEHSGDVPSEPGFVVTTIPAGSYLAFAFAGALARLPAAIDYLFGVWMPSSGHALRLAPSFERYAAGSIVHDTAELELWLPVE